MSGRATGQGQLALRFPLSSRCRFETFVVGANTELVRRLEDLDRSRRGFSGYLLFGPPGVGRTHLLQAVCHRHGDRGAICVPLPEAAPGTLEGLEALPLVALDDVDAWVGNAAGEAALLGLYQGMLAAGGRLLLTSTRPAGELQWHYPDLASRLASLAGYRVHELGDDGKATVLRRRAEERGLVLTEAVLDFWLARSSRDLAVLLAELERLDEAAMAAQRRLTVPLLKDVLGH